MDRASDIHIDPEGDHISIRYRIDGVLSEASESSSEQMSPSDAIDVKGASHYYMW